MKFNISNDLLKEKLEKRALGYNYSEEVCEFERKEVRGVMYCPNRKILYLKGGYIKVREVKSKSGEVSYLEPAGVNIKFISPSQVKKKPLKEFFKKFKRASLANFKGK